MTYTFAKLEVSRSAYDEIRAKLVKAGYEYAFGTDDDVELIDMRGIALVRAIADEEELTVCDGDLLPCSTCEKAVPVFARSRDFLCHAGHPVPVPDDVEAVVMRRRYRLPSPTGEPT